MHRQQATQATSQVGISQPSGNVTDRRVQSIAIGQARNLLVLGLARGAPILGERCEQQSCLTRARFVLRRGRDLAGLVPGTGAFSQLIWGRLATSSSWVSFDERPSLASEASTVHAGITTCTERGFFIDNLLVRIHLIIVMIRSTGLAPWEFGYHLPGSLTSSFLGIRHKLDVQGQIIALTKAFFK